MHRSLLPILALAATTLTTGLLAQNQPKASPTTAAAAPAAKEQKMIRVATLDTVEANRQFQANVQFVQGQRQAAIELHSRIEKETDAKKKASLQKELDELMAKLNENNRKMTEAYGFSLTRNYTLEIEKSHIYALVSEEEAAQIEQAQKEQAKKDAAAKKDAPAKKEPAKKK